jgi:alternate signal-mediated exported protein
MATNASGCRPDNRSRCRERKIVNKFLKSSLATTAGVALLLGGAGTLALWNDTAGINAGTVTSGVLDVTNASAGSWDKTIAKIVPGDTITYTDELQLTATGDNLKATVVSNIAAITNNITGATVTSTIVVTDSSDAVVTPAAGKYTLGGGSYTATVTLTVTFPTSVSNQVGQDLTTDFRDVVITVTQVA